MSNIVSNVLQQRLLRKQNKILEIKSNLTNLKSKIDGYKDSIEALKVNGTYKYIPNGKISEFYNLKAKTNPLIDEYNSILKDYNSLIKDYNIDSENYIDINKVVTKETIKYNPSNKNEWLPGGAFKNSLLPGGAFFSPIVEKNMKIDARPKLDFATAISTENLFSFLNKGYTDLKSTINSFGFLDLLNDYKISETIIYNIKIYVNEEEIISQNIIVNIDNSKGGGETSSSITTPNKTMSLSQMNEAMSFQDDKSLVSDVLGLLGYNSFTSVVAISITDLAQGKTAKAQSRVANFTINQAISTFSQLATSKALSALGITSQLGALGLFSAVKAVLTEAFEMAIGLDNHFGFGGEFLGENEFGEGMFSAPSSFAEVASDTFSEIGGFLTGQEVNTDTYNPDLTNVSVTDSAGNTIGFQSTSGNFTGMGGLAGFSDNFGNNIGNISDAIGGGGSFGQLSDPSGFGMDSVGDSNGLGFGNDDNGLGAGLGGINTGGLSSVGDANNGSGTTGGGRHCCTVLVKRKIWRLKRLKDLGKWDKKQNKIWKVGYQVGGKMVAKYYDKDEKIDDYTKMMNAFYDTHVLGKKRTWQTYRAYIRIYPMVYITGIYCIIKEKIKKFFRAFSCDTNKGT